MHTMTKNAVYMPINKNELTWLNYCNTHVSQFDWFGRSPQKSAQPEDVVYHFFGVGA